MSNKLGRNTPCHCGSGKKYKKCCLIVDQNVSIFEHNPDLLYEDIEEVDENDAVYGDSSDVSSVVSFDESNDNKFEDGEKSDFIPPVVEPSTKPKAKPLPEITDEEQHLIDAWWDKYLKAQVPDKRFAYLNTFLQEHPALVPHLRLEEEALFELGELSLRHKRGDEFINILMNIRENFPDVYMKSYAYYDSDLVVYHVCRGEEEKAARFMDNFMAYPDDDPDVLFVLVFFLCASNQHAILSTLLEKNYLKILYSDRIVGGSKIIEPYIWSCHFIPELENGYDEKSMVALANTFKTLKIDFRDEYYQSEFLLEKLNNITKDNLVASEGSLEEKYQSSSDIMSFYDQVSMNYMGWLHKEKNIPWLTAYYYNTIVFKYFYRSIPDKKRPRKPFLFIEKQFEKTIVEMSQFMFSLDVTLALSSLRAFYLFAEYLLVHQALSKIESLRLKKVCKRLNSNIINDLSKQNFEAQYFVDDFWS